MSKKRIFELMAVICLICCMLCGCGELEGIMGSMGLKSSPEDTIKQLEKAINNADMEKMLDCCPSSVSKVLSGGSSLLGDLLGFDMDAAAELASGLLGMSSDPLDGNHISMDVTDVEYQDEEEENCIVTVAMETSNDSGRSETGTYSVPMVLEDGKWKLEITLEDLGLE